jgi:hypothetical protein
VKVSELIDLLSKQESDADVVMPDGLNIESIYSVDSIVYLCDLDNDGEVSYSPQMEEDYFFPDDYASLD